MEPTRRPFEALGVADNQAVAGNQVEDHSQAEDHSRPGRTVEVVEGSTHPGRVAHLRVDRHQRHCESCEKTRTRRRIILLLLWLAKIIFVGHDGRKSGR